MGFFIKKNYYDHKKRNTVYLQEIHYIISSFILKDKRIRKFLKYYCLTKFYSNFQSKTKLINMCVVTKRTKSVYKFAKISRMVLRDNFFINKLPGLKKSYW